ncbi:MAG: hypothetical protein ACO1NW_19095 [Chitinophagaceae bacterium]
MKRGFGQIKFNKKKGGEQVPNSGRGTVRKKQMKGLQKNVSKKEEQNFRN